MKEPVRPRRIASALFNINLFAELMERITAMLVKLDVQI